MIATPTMCPGEDEVRPLLSSSRPGSLSHGLNHKGMVVMAFLRAIGNLFCCRDAMTTSYSRQST